MPSSGCAIWSGRSGGATDEPWPCEVYPLPELEVEIALTRQSVTDPALRDWLDRLDRLRADLDECWRVQR
ncbi:MAG: hypothetical protein ACE5EV_02410 [Gaiellales bacterium]